MLGRRVLALPARPLAPGSGQEIHLDMGALTPGIYLYRVRANSGGHATVETGRMVLIQ